MLGTVQRGWGSGGKWCAGILGTGALPPNFPVPPAPVPGTGWPALRPLLPRTPTVLRGGSGSPPSPHSHGCPGHPQPSRRGHPVPSRRIPACTAAAAAFPWRWHLPSPHSLSGRVSMEMPYPARHNLSKRFPPRCCSRDPRTRSGAIPSEMGGQDPWQWLLGQRAVAPNRSSP